MKIFIISSAFPYRGGIANFAGLLYTELSKNHSVTVVTFKRQYPSFLFPGKSQLEPDNHSVKIPSVQLIDSINPVTWYMTAKHILNEKPDLVIFKYWLPFFSPSFGFIAGKLKKQGIPLACIFHNVIPHERIPGDKILSMYFVRKVDHFITLSESVKNDLSLLVPDKKTLVLFHPVLSFFGELTDKKIAKEYLQISAEKLLLFFGIVREYKGLDVLINALSRLSSLPDLKLLVAGEFYSDKNSYLKLIEKKGLMDKIIVRDNFIPASEVKYYFSAADAVILPYRSATQSGIVQIAMNFRKPVIASDVGGLSEVVKHGITGYIVEKENPQKLADAILNFYENNKERDFVKNVENEVGKYSWSNFVAQMISFVSSEKN
ncbi:MAG: glycosyltransferase family 4 protein [Ignavibacteriaceae bacterium]